MDPRQPMRDPSSMLWIMRFFLMPAMGLAALQCSATAPQITVQPKSQAVVMGSGVEFTVVASGTEPLNYEWRKDGVPIPDPIMSIPPLPTQPRLGLNSTNFDSLGEYTVKVSNADGFALSSAAVLTFSLAARALSYPVVPVAVGGAAEMKIEGIGDGLRYQWLKNGVTIPNATGAALQIAAASIGDQDRYHVVVSNAAGAINGGSFLLTIANPPWFSVLPTNQAGDVGTTVQVQAVALGSGPITYQWYKDDTVIVGATGPTLRWPRIQLADAGEYHVIASNAAGQVTSPSAVVTIRAPAGLPVITRQPASQHLKVGGEVMLDAAASAAALPLSTDWYCNGNRLISRSTGVRASESGMYVFAASDNNRVGPVLSLPATVTLANDAYYTFTTVAGFAHVQGAADGPVATATFFQPMGIGLGHDGTLYVADSENRTIRKITPSGVVSLLAGGSLGNGNGDGTGTSARFWFPMGLAVDRVDNVYVADSGGPTIRRITPAGVVTTIAGTAGKSGGIDGTGGDASFDSPQALAIDASGNIYVVEARNSTIRKITPSGVVTTIAGSIGVTGFVNGPGTSARFNHPQGIAVDGTGGILIADTGNSVIRRIGTDGQVTTFAGTDSGRRDGPAATAKFTAPAGIAVGPAGNVFVAENDTIRLINVAGIVSTVAGNPLIEGGRVLSDGIDGTGEDAKFRGASAVAVNAAGEVYLAETSGDIRKGVAPDGGDLALITRQPASQVIAQGGTAVLSVVATSATPLTYQWQFGGAYLAGETTESLTRVAVGAASAGNYSVLVQNRSGIVVSNPAKLDVTAATNITSQPRYLSSPGSAALTIAASPPPTPGPLDPPNPATVLYYQWLLDGAPIAGATSAALNLSTPGSYRAWVGNSAGAVLSDEALVLGATAAARLRNLSVRTRAGTGGETLILGFGVTPIGSASHISLLLRAVGPGLASFGVPAVLPNPLLALYQGSAVVATNDNWGDNAAGVAAVGDQVGAFRLTDPQSLDAALYLPAIAATTYTAQVTPATGAPGTALAEMYDAEPADAAFGSFARLINVSARAQVGPDNPLIAGFSIAGSAPKRLLIRGVGQSLSHYQVTDGVAHPQLSLYADKIFIASNDDWRRNGDSYVPLAAVSGAFPLDTAYADTALIVSLAPGTYSAVVTTSDGASGSALVEVYDLDK